MVAKGGLISSLLFSLCQRHALTIAPRRVSPLSVRHGNHTHVPQADAPGQLPGIIQRPKSVDQ